jgi:hypothetical protein
MPLGVAFFSFFFKIRVVFLTGPDASGKITTPTGILQFFFKKKQKKKEKTSLSVASLQRAADTDALPFVFLKF